MAVSAEGPGQFFHRATAQPGASNVLARSNSPTWLTPVLAEVLPTELRRWVVVGVPV